MKDKVSLRDYVDVRFKALTLATRNALLASEKASDKADTVVEKRFDGVNEFRQTLTDQAAHFVTKVEYDALKERMDRRDGQLIGIQISWGIIIAIIGIAFSTALYFKQ